MPGSEGYCGHYWWREDKYGEADGITAHVQVPYLHSTCPSCGDERFGFECDACGETLELNGPVHDCPVLGVEVRVTSNLAGHAT